jgi:hypothetical protein
MYRKINMAKNKYPIAYLFSNLLSLNIANERRIDAIRKHLNAQFTAITCESRT